MNRQVLHGNLILVREERMTAKKVVVYSSPG